jgi:hypothetical protein
MARDIAFNLLKSFYTEYGVKEIIINKTWERIIWEAKEIAQLEIEEIQKKDNIDHWKWEINKLQEIINM